MGTTVCSLNAFYLNNRMPVVGRVAMVLCVMFLGTLALAVKTQPTSMHLSNSLTPGCVTLCLGKCLRRIRLLCTGHRVCRSCLLIFRECAPRIPSGFSCKADRGLGDRNWRSRGGGVAILSRRFFFNAFLVLPLHHPPQPSPFALQEQTCSRATCKRMPDF